MRVTTPRGSEHTVRRACRDNLARAWSCNGRLHRHLPKRQPHRIPVLVVRPVAVVRRLPVALERLREHADVGKPLHRSHAIVPGHNHTKREAVVDRDFFAVHRVRDDNIFHFPHGDTAGVLCVPWRNGLLPWYSGVGCLKQDFAGVRVDSRPFQQNFERNAGPLRRAYGA